jgi:hypothetical protein
MNYPVCELVEVPTSRGPPVRVWRTVKMPRVPAEYLQCSIYLYDSYADADGGKARSGACGFLVGFGSRADGRYSHLYAVTNRHVVAKCGDSCRGRFIRINTTDGRYTIAETQSDDWRRSNDDELAVCPLLLHKDTHAVAPIPADSILTKELATDHVGIGDEVFLIGRFVDHEGRQHNSPTLRFGHVAMTPDEPLQYKDDDGNICEQKEAYLVEVQSRSGYSGSPVIVCPYSSFGHALDRHTRKNYDEKMHAAWLLGVHFKQLHGLRSNRAGNLEDFDTGMSGVVPAWRLLDLLNTKELVMKRKETDRRLKEESDGQNAGGLESISEPPMDQAAFEAALKKVSRRVPPAPDTGPETPKDE